MSKVAIIPDRPSGIGAHRDRARRAGDSRTRQLLQEQGAAEKVAAQCKDAIAVQADVGEDADCRKLAQAAIDKWGRIERW